MSETTIKIPAEEHLTMVLDANMKLYAALAKERDAHAQTRAERDRVQAEAGAMRRTLELIDAWAAHSGLRGHAPGQIHHAVAAALAPDAGRALLAERDRLRDEVKALRLRDACVVCGADLLPPDAPPHCLDCNPTEEHEIAWHEARAALGEGE
jgi:hypothetical protein